LSDVEAFVDQNAYYMDYLKQKEWKLNDELFAYLRQRVCYYEKAENIWFIRDFDEVNNRYSYKSVKDKHLYNTNIYVDTGIEKRKPLKSVIGMCLTLSFVEPCNLQGFTFQYYQVFLSSTCSTLLQVELQADSQQMRLRERFHANKATLRKTLQFAGF
jgi:hypothetical protein